MTIAMILQMKMLEMIQRKFRAPSNIKEVSPPARGGTARWLWIVCGIFVPLVVGCLRIPEEDWIISQEGSTGMKKEIANCTAIYLNQSISAQMPADQMAPDQTIRSSELNPDGFRFASWNIRKGKAKGWADDFRKLSQSTDIFILQEAYLSDGLKKVLRQSEYQWDMSVAFENRQIEAGVLTASIAAPNFACTFRETEPITRIPKSVLITRYPMSGADRELLVANIHAINFTLGNSKFQEQSNRLERLLAVYHGPMILSGDFNTWNRDRMAYVEAMAERLDLAAVRFKRNRRSQFFGQNVDHVYYRGLEVMNVKIPIVSTSDHNPLTVVFKLADESEAGF